MDKRGMKIRKGIEKEFGGKKKKKAGKIRGKWSSRFVWGKG